MKRHPLYGVWAVMKSRCSNPKSQGWSNYGGRGITVCEEWQEFEPFFKWAIGAGWALGLLLDRENTNGNYCPSNCRFVTPKISGFNRRTTRATPELVAEVMRLRGQGTLFKHIAAQLGLSKTTVVNWAQGKKGAAQR